ncbi:MAG: sugar-binding protein [Pseudomonadota bacterium]
MRSLAAIVLLSLSAPSLAAIGDNSVGMNVHDGRQDFIDACVDLGVKWVRLDGNWLSVKNQSASSQNWQYLDNAVNAAQTAGLQVYITLGYTPDWVPRRDNGDGNQGNDLPNSSTEWVQFVTEAVNRYKDRVTHFGMWNESNLDSFLTATAAEYWSVIVAPGAAAVRAACPTCKVLGPDLAHVGDVDDYLEDFFNQPAINAVAPVQVFDIVTHHSYNGFPELGTDVWDGDRFFNALDEQRFTWPVASRRSLRQILDGAGYHGEVWITETGYRATPDDATEEQRQATYLTLVLEEQLARDWYTNTFFYEIYDCKPDQPTCDIDGFGLMHALSADQNRSFPSSYRLKPAFTALKQFIATHPEITDQGARPACSDGQDNDGDGRTDLADRGCSNALDDDESDDPARRRIQAYRTPGLTVDGNLGDIGSDGWLTLDGADWVGSESWGGVQDCSLRVAARWDLDNLVLGIEVTDDVHRNDRPPAELWQGDSLQIALDLGQSGGPAYDDVDDHEINVALSSGVTSSYRFHGPAAASDAWQVAVAREGTLTRYEVRLPRAAVPGIDLSVNAVIGFSFLVNDDDGAGRTGWLEFTPGIGQAKVPELFGEIVLLSATSGGLVDAGSPADATTSRDAMAQDLTGSPDTATQTDAVGQDLGSAPDAHSTADGGISSDATGIEDAGIQDAAPGCACRASRYPGFGLWGGLATLWVLRRKRRHAG